MPDTQWTRAMLVRLPDDRTGQVVIGASNAPVAMLLELLAAGATRETLRCCSELSDDEYRVLAQLAGDIHNRAHRDPTPDDVEALRARVAELAERNGDA